MVRPADVCRPWEGAPGERRAIDVCRLRATGQALHVQMGADADRGAFRIRVWGAGAEWARTSVPDLLGARDDWSGLDLSDHARLAEKRRRCSGLHLTRTGLVLSTLVAAIFGQKTTGRQEHHSWRYLVVRYGSAASGRAPHGLRVTASAQEWNLIPSWVWHRAGVQPSQFRAAIAASRVAASVDRLASLDAGDGRLGAGLRSIPASACGQRPEPLSGPTAIQIR